MPLQLKRLPKESILNLWLEAEGITEVPVSYQIVTALSAIGALLGRGVWVDQVEWRVYPNLSVLLVGPSGIGKDVAIRAAGRLVDANNPGLTYGGKTMEALVEQVMKAQQRPACAFILAPEITAFLGGKDYQKSMVQELTDILSTGDKVDVSLKSSPGVKRILWEPTWTLQAGSTEEWLHEAMPTGSLEGGLFPRFLIICEEYGDRHVPWIKYSTEGPDRRRALQAKMEFEQAVGVLVERFANGGEVVPTLEAREFYENWYINRFKRFGPTVRSYANRSRDQLLRVAMLVALTCGRRFMEACDMEFAEDIMDYVALKLERATKPPTYEGQIARVIIGMLPCTQQGILKELAGVYPRRNIYEALQLMIESGQMVANGGVWKKPSPEA
jgi:hypothetical protein